MTAHQDISGALFTQLYIFLSEKPGKVYHAPFDVRLFGDGDEETTVVQPDIVVILNKEKIDEKGCNGAPDLLIEILSPSTARHDKVRKFNQYRLAGVREYWIVDPDKKSLSVHVLGNGAYVTMEYCERDTVPVHVLEGCVIRLPDVFVGSFLDAAH